MTCSRHLCTMKFCWNASKGFYNDNTCKFSTANCRNFRHSALFCASGGFDTGFDDGNHPVSTSLCVDFLFRIKRPSGQWNDNRRKKTDTCTSILLLSLHVHVVNWQLPKPSAFREKSVTSNYCPLETPDQSRSELKACMSASNWNIVRPYFHSSSMQKPFIWQNCRLENRRRCCGNVTSHFASTAWSEAKNRLAMIPVTFSQTHCILDMQAGTELFVSSFLCPYNALWWSTT